MTPLEIHQFIENQITDFDLALEKMLIAYCAGDCDAKEIESYREAHRHLFDLRQDAAYLIGREQTAVEAKRSLN